MRAQDGALTGALASLAHLGRTWDFAAKYDAGLAAVTVADANAVLRKYLATSGFAWSFAGDFKGK